MGAVVVLFRASLTFPEPLVPAGLMPVTVARVQAKADPLVALVAA